MKFSETIARMLLIACSMGLSVRFIILYFQPYAFYKTNMFDLWFDWMFMFTLSWVNMYMLIKSK